jgi:hypothetical protein
MTKSKNSSNKVSSPLLETYQQSQLSSLKKESNSQTELTENIVKKSYDQVKDVDLPDPPLIDFDLDQELKKYENKKIPIELAVLHYIRTQDFKIKLDNQQLILPSDIQKYRITLNGNYVDFKFVKYQNYNYFIPFEKNNFINYDIKMYDLENLPININDCDIILKDKRTYNFKHFIINIDLLNRGSTKTFIPILSPTGKLISYKEPERIYPPSNFQKPKLVEVVAEDNPLSKDSIKAKENEIEMSTDLSKMNIQDIIWYLKTKSNNRRLDEYHVDDFEYQLQLYDQNYLYENIFVNPQNYTSNAIAIILCMAPFFYTYPRFYNISMPIIIVGIVGLLMCMNTIQTQYGVILKNKQLSNIYIGCIILFYIIFFVLFNKLNHIVLFFLSAGIVFMIMNYILRIIISDPKKGLGFRRLQYNANNVTYTLYNQRIEKICDEVRKRYKLNMDSKQFYKYITSYEVVDKSKNFMTTEFVCNIVQPILGVIVLYLMGGILNKAKDYTLLKSNTQLLQEELLKRGNPKVKFEQPEYAFLPSPLIAFTEMSNNIISNQYNYVLPKQLNLHYIMEEIIDEVNDKIIQTKSAHVYEKTIFNEKIIKNLDKYMRRFLRFMESEYLPVCVMDSNSNDNQQMHIETLRKDNRYNMFDGTFNRVHDVLDRHELISLNSSEIEDYYESILKSVMDSNSVDSRMKSSLTQMIQNSCKDYLFYHTMKMDDFIEKLNGNFYTYLYKITLGKSNYEKLKTNMDLYMSQMSSTMEELKILENDIAQYKSRLDSLSQNDSRYAEYLNTYQTKSNQYQTLISNYNGIKSYYDQNQYTLDNIRIKYEQKMNESKSTLASYMKELRVELKDDLFVTLIQHIQENNEVVDLDERNNAMDNIKYKFKDIYDFITNEELFNEKEQSTLINIIEVKIRNILEMIYAPSIDYNRNNIILGNITPNGMKRVGNTIFQYILQPIASWILLGKLVGSGWYGGKMAMADINKDYVEIVRNFEYDGHFSSIWKICSMGVDRMYYERKMGEHRELLVEKVKSMNPASRVIYYIFSFLFFILFGILLNAYNNMVFGMSMYPLWTNLPALVILLIILIVIYFMRK